MIYSKENQERLGQLQERAEQRYKLARQYTRIVERNATLLEDLQKSIEMYKSEQTSGDPTDLECVQQMQEIIKELNAGESEKEDLSRASMNL